MVAGLGAEFYLAQAFVRSAGSPQDSLGKQIRIHKMGTGAGREEASILYEPHAVRIDLPVSFGSAFYMVL